MANQRPRRIPAVEWVSAAIGVAIVATMFGFLSIEAIRQRNGVPPVMEVVPVGLFATEGRYIVEFEVRNSARKTGASVGVEGALKRAGEEVETSSATLAYVPGQSSRRGGLVFTRDPRGYRLQMRVTGYERP